LYTDHVTLIPMLAKEIFLQSRASEDEDEEEGKTFPLDSNAKAKNIFRSSPVINTQMTFDCAKKGGGKTLGFGAGKKT
jgi:hypothetical protein